MQVNSALHSASVGSQAAEEFTTTDAQGYTDWCVIVLYDDRSYVIDLVSPAAQFPSARTRYFMPFLADWHWR